MRVLQKNSDSIFSTYHQKNTVKLKTLLVYQTLLVYPTTKRSEEENRRHREDVAKQLLEHDWFVLDSVLDV